jgi:hypothetical protein
MYVYLIRCEENNYYKIGITKNIERRLKQIQTGTPDKIYLVEKYESDFSSKIEKALHNYFIYCHRNNEWFELTLEDELKFLDLCKSMEKNFIFLKENKI